MDARNGLQSPQDRPERPDPSSPAPAVSTAGPRILLILGMHRSGTSAVAGLLSIMGAERPRVDIGANEGNLLGHFEPKRIVDLHDAILAELGQAWSDWWPMEAEALAGADAARWVDQLTDLVRQDFSLQRPLVLKDPRICRLMPLWRAVARRLGAELRIVIPWREPSEVAASLARRDGLSMDVGRLMWLRHVLDAERETRDLPRVFCDYREVIADWPAVLARIARALDMTLVPNAEQEAAANAFITPQLRRERATPGGGEAGPEAVPWLGEALQALSELRQDPYSASGSARLDQLHARLCGGDAGADADPLHVSHRALAAALIAERRIRLRHMLGDLGQTWARQVSGAASRAVVAIRHSFGRRT